MKFQTIITDNGKILLDTGQLPENSEIVVELGEKQIKISNEVN